MRVRLDQVRSREGGSDSGYILKVDPRGFADRMKELEGGGEWKMQNGTPEATFRVAS